MTRHVGLKVYGWTGTKMAPGNPQRQSRNIIAATSVAEALRLSGTRRSEYAWTGAPTGNDEERAQALSKPGAMFWRPLDDRNGDTWYEEPTTEGTKK